MSQQEWAVVQERTNPRQDFHHALAACDGAGPGQQPAGTLLRGTARKPPARVHLTAPPSPLQSAHGPGPLRTARGPTAWERFLECSSA